VPVLFLVSLVLIGYYGIFLGANFFTEEDPATLYGYSHGNAIGNGWRPDKGFGTSFFFGDPGAFHAWTVFSLWERLFSTPYRAYNISVMALLILAVLSQYVFLVNLVPGIGNFACVMAPLIVFGPLQYEFFFQRHWITMSIGTPLLLLLLDDFLKKAKAVHYAAAGLLFWFVLFFGSVAPLEELWIVGGIFTVIHSLQHHESIVRKVSKWIGLCLVGGVTTLLLGAWVFYSIVLESRMINYVRDPNYLSAYSVSLPSLILFFSRFLHSSWFPAVAMAVPLGFDEISWRNCSPLMPVVLAAVIFRRSKTSWEFSLKTLWVVLIANEFLYTAVPAYGRLSATILNLYPLEKFQPAYHCFEIVFLGWYVVEARDTGFSNTYRWAAGLQRFIGYFLFAFYSLLAFGVMLFMFDYNRVVAILRTLIARTVPDQLFGYSRAFVTEVAVFNAGQVHAVCGWTALCFYLLTAFLVLLLSRPSWLSHALARWQFGVGSLLVLHALLFSWFVFPLNGNPLVWSGSAGFQPTDRFYQFVDPAQTNVSLGSVEHFRNTWVNVDGEFGPREVRTGYLETPGLNLSGTKSFSPVEARGFALAAFNDDGRQRIGDVRSLEIGPLHNSDLVNMAAVSYYYSLDPMTVNRPLEPFFHAKQLSVYKNTEAWPYFYLAGRLEVANNKPPAHVSRDTAYVSAGDYFDLAPPSQNDVIGLTAFSLGDMQFHYTSAGERFMVVADSWHPFWKATIDGQPARVVKANWIFKGARLPAGRHSVRFYFDTTPYYVGIYVSAAAWIVFIIIFVRVWYLR
jgi:hypothetical protein